MSRKIRKSHTAEEFGLNTLSGNMDIFRWFLLCYLFGKPIHAETAMRTWQKFIQGKLDTPWAITNASEQQLVDCKSVWHG